MKVRLSKRIAVFVILACTSLTLLGRATAQQALRPQLAGGLVSDVPIGIQNLRFAMLDAEINALTFRSMDALFTTRTVARSGSVWQLPRDDHALDFDYQYDGKTFQANQFLDRSYTNALLILKNGKIVFEKYLNESSDRTRFMGFSMTKSITSMLIGCALAERRIKSLDERIDIYLPELKGGGYEGVTIRQVMQMRSGVDYEERYDFQNPGVAARNHIDALVKNVVRFADVARSIERKHPPGEVFQYKTLDTAVLGLLLERVSDGSNLAAYMAKHLWEPIGAESDGFFIMDGAPGVGREFSGAGFNATLRDFARLGLMMLNKGAANGHQILSSEWVTESTRPTDPAHSEPRGYGYQWWTIGNEGAYTALGLQGQYIFVDPATHTVVVKLSYFPPGEKRASDETVAFLKAASAWQPH
ncbi:serine hydrolase domain-containing protein [Bradyrhizobium sp. CCBAU 51627]|uniref:serine hydrolase domain-containing protein n=1 Tax=Bradyrhizobium sp. CCBAU 51627 TaxID=1325088 RepID=UPI0023057D30|nr:serine hydrolase [Bradyrhizobium sp. CCBAU 51627]MDA9433565.1 6-aminohexanoate hydrolase [Bradyrhizobium sp. CCBAU 51627]